MLRDFWRGVVGGLFKSSPFAVWLMVAIGAGGALIGAFSPSITVRALTVYPGLELIDDYPYAYIRSVIERETKPDLPAIYVLGGSTMRESIDSEKAMTEGVSSKLGAPVRVVDLSTWAEPVWMSDEIGTTALCGDRRGVLFVAVNWSRAAQYSPAALSKRVNWPGLKPRSPLEDAKARVEFLSSLFGTELRRTVLQLPARLSALATGTEFSPKLNYSYSWGRHEYLHDKISADNVTKTVQAFWDRAAAEDPAIMDAYFSDLAQFISNMKSCGGLQIVLVDTPINPKVFEAAAAQATLARYNDRMVAFANAQGVRFINLYQEVSYGPRDFVDYAHLRRRDAMARTTAYLADTAAELLGAPKTPQVTQ